MVTVMVALLPGAMVTGAGPLAAATAAALTGPPALLTRRLSRLTEAARRIAATTAGCSAGCTAACQTSPVDEVTAGSNNWPCASADTDTEPAGAGAAYGPVCPRSAPHNPGDTCLAAIRTSALLPCAAEYTAGRSEL